MNWILFEHVHLVLILRENLLLGITNLFAVTRHYQFCGQFFVGLFELGVDMSSSIFESGGVGSHAFVFGLAVLQLQGLSFDLGSFFLLQNTTTANLIGVVLWAASLGSLIFDWGLASELVRGVSSSECTGPISRVSILRLKLCTFEAPAVLDKGIHEVTALGLSIFIILLLCTQVAHYGHCLVDFCNFLGYLQKFHFQLFLFFSTAIVWHILCCIVQVRSTRYLADSAHLAPIGLERLSFSLIQLEYLLLLRFGIYSWALVIVLHQLLKPGVANTQPCSHRLLLGGLYNVLITFSLWLIILFKLDFPSYCLLWRVVGSSLTDGTGKVRYRKHRIFLLMFSILADERLRGFRYSRILSPEAALELTTHWRYVQAIARCLGSNVVGSIGGNVSLHHWREVDACLWVLKGVLSRIAIWKDAGTHHLHMVQNGASLKIFVAILCFRLPQHVQISIAIIDQFPLLVLPEIGMRPQLSFDTSLLFLICIINNRQVPLLVRRVLL